MSNVQSLERALTLLNALSDYPDGIQIARLTEQVGLSKSTTHRLLATLSSMNYVVKDPETDKYKLGLQILFLSRNILNQNNVVSTARPYLEKLSAEVNETVHLCVEDLGEVTYIDKIESNQTIRMFSRIGSRAPMYCTGVGKVLYAGMAESRLEQLIAQVDFVPKTKNTITSAEALRKEIQKVKQQGYALDDVENEEGIRCIAAPIYNHEGKIVASFSISGPSNRVTLDLVNGMLIDKVKQTSMEISRSLGYVGGI
ncbi:IclR family transcriptional regulator [Paenibacillus puldeungensis]|uniref:IclR family transcriptional regulator n=1 Tax=Paenibacillus puldeungensis TaxID=696536 RepID=A0ABW3RYS6_9BACL